VRRNQRQQVFEETALPTGPADHGPGTREGLGVGLGGYKKGNG
jgi:hypothetical protein